jgi:hypothetical protein
MRADWSHLEKYRDLSTSYRGDRYGWFIVHRAKGTLRMMASEGDKTVPWEHVSISPAERRTPTWAEMSYVKSLFWGPEECVMQLHPPESVYVNLHPYTLHLWKPTQAEIPLPPKIAVGPG